jgi:hypothetical protein
MAIKKPTKPSKITQGGARRGAGRPVVLLPHEQKSTFTFRLSDWVISALHDKVPKMERSAGIEKAIIKHYKLVRPASPTKGEK